MGTDTVEALWAAKWYYNAVGPVGFSIPASEHSTITAWGEEHEVDAYSNMIDKYSKPGALYSCVSDSYNIFKATENLWGGILKDKVIASGGTLVVRPDSGDPVETPIRVMEILAEQFGYTINTKGYKVLNPAVRVIQGDGLDPITINDLMFETKKRKFSLENIAFGMGGGLLQKVNRDTLKFSQKTNAVMIDGVWRDVSEKPFGSAWKTSKAGILALKNGSYRTILERSLYNPKDNLLQPIWSTGKLIRETDFNDVRKNAEIK